MRIIDKIFFFSSFFSQLKSLESCADFLFFEKYILIFSFNSFSPNPKVEGMDVCILLVHQIRVVVDVQIHHIYLHRCGVIKVMVVVVYGS